MLNKNAIVLLSYNRKIVCGIAVKEAFKCALKIDLMLFLPNK